MWDFPGKNTAAGCHFLIQGIEPACPVLAGGFFTTELPGKLLTPKRLLNKSRYGWDIKGGGLLCFSVTHVYTHTLKNTIINFSEELPFP